MNARSIVRNTILDLLGCFATPSVGIHILNGHRITLANLDVIPTSNIFRQQLQELKRYVRFISFEEAVRLIHERVNVNEVLVAFSFDDGFEECYTMIAPVLEEFGISAAFFINPNFASGDTAYIHTFTEHIVLTPGKKPMRWNQIIDLHKHGHIIGAHTLDHHMMKETDEQTLDNQISQCKTRIEEQLCVPCNYFAFPYGRLEDASPLSIDIAMRHYPFIFSQSNYKQYYSFDDHVINRRHFEPDWPINHVLYFISHKKEY